MTEKESAITIDVLQILRNYLKNAKRFWWFLAACAVLLAVLVPIVCKQIVQLEYKATCSFSVRVVNSSVTDSLYNQYDIYYDKDLAQQLDTTFTYILTSDYLSDEVRQELGKELEEGRITAKCITGSNLFEITVLGDTPQEAYDMLVTVMEVFPRAARYVVGDLMVEMLEEPSAGEKPSNAVNTKVTALAGAAGGFALASVILVFAAGSARTVHKPEDLEEVLNMSCLGVVPLTRERTNNITEGEFRESIRGISRKVEMALERENAKVLLVTGTSAGEGKSLLARYLAQTLAEWGKRVYLVDCDLRKPSLYKLFKCGDQELPLEEYLRGEKPLDAVLCQTSVKRLTLVGNSKSVQEPTVLLASQTMKDMIAQLADNCDYVVLDAPPCESLSDVEVLQTYAQKIVYVVRQDYAPRDRIVDTVQQLTDEGSKLLGFTLNFAEKTVGGYGKYGYGAYSYGKYGNGYYGKYGHYNHYNKYYQTEQREEPSEK